MNEYDDEDEYNDKNEFIQWPLRIQRSGSRQWNIVYYNSLGNVTHISSAETQMGAYRAAHAMARLYDLQGDIVLESSTGRSLIDINKVMNKSHF
ncbi:MAG: hypothetical protein HQL49_01195 [Gammaproteobacteria bacterium]|nr:hypothetical protein [Gammaproteobacteria bacterium]